MLAGLLAAVTISATPTPNPAVFPPLLKWVESQELMRSNLLGPFPRHVPVAQTSVVDCFQANGEPGVKTGCRYGMADFEWGEYTAFNTGPAGPERYAIQYDAKHGLARVTRGCCSWHQDILLSGVTPPPEVIVQTDLSGRSTFNGLRLGDSGRDVERIFGPHAAVTHSGGVDALFYRHAYRDPAGAGCGEDDTILLRSDRVVAIGFTNGC